jgi:hypothetical protein
MKPSPGKWPKLPNFAQHQQDFNTGTGIALAGAAYNLLSVSDRFLAHPTLSTNIPSSQGGRRLKGVATPNTVPERQYP